jgi:preprotein translocase subunit SecF
MSTTTDALSAEDVARPVGVFKRLYRGETSFDFVGRRRWWFALSGVIIIAGAISLGTRGLNFGIDFRGGQQWEVTAPGLSVSKVQSAVSAAGIPNATVQILGGKTVQVSANLNGESFDRQQTTKANVSTALTRLTNGQQVSVTDVGPTWGSQITKKALIAVIVFFIVVVAYISLRFEWKMAIAALLAVIHDLMIVAGIYSLSGFQVTSDTVIAVLTILGYSLYDTVVVFDRVADNTKGLGASGRMTYEDVVNLSMNQTLARSINTSLVAILPVLSVLVIGAQFLGATTLQYFGLALVIGLTSGAYSSIFIASPVLSMMKEREPRYVGIRQKLASRADRTGLLTPRAAAMLSAASAGGQRSGGRAVAGKAVKGRPAPAAAKRSGVLRPAAATAAAKRAATTVAEPDADDDLDLEEAEADGAGNGQRAPKTAAGAAKRTGAGGGGGGGQARRPGPRPRKSKGSRKGRRR